MRPVAGRRWPRPVKTLAGFARLPAETRVLALEAAVLLLAARLLVDHVPMRRWRPRVDVATAPVPCPSTSPAPGAPAASRETGDAARVGRIVDRVARRLPFATSCLARAMTGHWLLRRRGVRSRLAFGVRRAAAPDGALEFHAWLSTAAGNVVVGGGEVETYAPLALPEVVVREAGDGAAPPPARPAGPTRMSGGKLQWYDSVRSGGEGARRTMEG